MIRSHYICMLMQEEKHFPYASLQYTLPPAFSAMITTIRTTKIPSERIDWGEDDETYEPHVTIFYGLSETDYPCIKDHLEGSGPLQFALCGTPKVFDTPSHDVLVLPLVSDDFRRLHMKIRQWTGKEPPVYKRFSPHVTLCYLKKGFSLNYDSFFGTQEGIATTLSFQNKKGISKSIVL